MRATQRPFLQIPLLDCSGTQSLSQRSKPRAFGFRMLPHSERHLDSFDSLLFTRNICGMNCQPHLQETRSQGVSPHLVEEQLLCRKCTHAKQL